MTFSREGDDIAALFAQKQISITRNLIHDTNAVTYPIRAGWTDNFAGIYAFDGDDALTSEPLFVSPAEGNFTLQPDSPSGNVGAFPAGMPVAFWWKEDFPPKIVFDY